MAHERRDELFCTCESGQVRRRYYLRVVSEQQAFIDETMAANAATRQHIADEAFAEQQNHIYNAGIPPLYAESDLNAFAETFGNDQDKIEGITAAKILIEHGRVNYNGHEKHSLILYSGIRGTGKTTIATAVYKAMILAGKTGIWTTFSQALVDIRDGYNDKTAYERVREFQNAEVLLFDDIGTPWRGTVSAHTIEMTQLIIHHRHMWMRPTLITSNLGPYNLQKQFGEETWQRIGQMAAVVEFGGQIIRPY